MSTFPLFTMYAWIGQGFHSIKEIPNHGHSISGVDWGAQHSCVEISYGNSTNRYKSNQHMDTPHTFSHYSKTTLNHGLSLSDVDWGDLNRESTEHGEDYHKGHLPPLLMEYLKDSFDTEQIEDQFSKSESIKGYRSSSLFLTLNNMKVATIYLLNGILGRNPCNLHSSGRKTQVSSLKKHRVVTEFSTKLGLSQFLMVQKVP